VFMNSSDKMVLLKFIANTFKVDETVKVAFMEGLNGEIDLAEYLPSRYNWETGEQKTV
jgi:hypothetical protein